MEPRARYVLMGLSVMVLISALVFFSLWLFKPERSEETRKYTILFRGVSLAGVRPDSAVTLQGVKVGSVESVEIEPRDIEKTRLRVQIKQSIPIKTNTRARVMANLLTQIASVELVGSTRESQELTDIPAGEKYPVIEQAEDSAGLAWQENASQTLREVSAAARRVEAVAEDLHLWASPENRRAFSELLENARSISSDLSGKTNRLEALLLRADEVMQQVSKVVGELNNPRSPIGKALIDTSDVISREMVNISSDISKIGEKIGMAARTFEEPRSAIFGPAKNQYGPGEKRE